MFKNIINVKMDGEISMEPVITVIGSYAAGLTMKTKRFPTCGETLIGSGYQQLHGGKGSNQAVECARLGAKVNFIGCIGRDNLGESALELYKREGINSSYIKFSDKLSTGVGFIMVDDNGNNIILIDFGANQELSSGYIKSMEDVISSSDAVLIQLEIPIATALEASVIAKRHGVKVILNPAPYQPLPDEIWENVTTVIPNEKEALLIAGFTHKERIPVEKLSQIIRDKGVDQVIITLGENGAYVSSGSIGMLADPYKVEVIDTTGAGDCFDAGFLYSYLRGEVLERSLRCGNICGGLSTRARGTVAAPHIAELNKYLDY
jgi:ribokinase